MRRLVITLVVHITTLARDMSGWQFRLWEGRQTEGDPVRQGFSMTFFESTQNKVLTLCKYKDIRLTNL